MQGARQPASSKLKGTHKHAAGSLLDKSAVTALSHSNTVLRNETHHSQLGTGKLEALYGQDDPVDDLI